MTQFDQNKVLLLKKLLHVLIKNGKKEIALEAFLYLLKELNSYNKKYSSVEIIYKSFENINPILSTQKVKKASRVFYLPRLINEEQKISLGLAWLLKSVNTRKEKTLNLRLLNEFLDCFKGKSSTISKKQGLYEIIKVNRPFLNLLTYR